MPPAKLVPPPRVQSIMRTQIVTVPPEATVRELLRILADENLNGAPVVGGDGRLVGVVSAGDVLRRITDIPADPTGADAAYFFTAEGCTSLALQALRLMDADRLSLRVRDVALPAALTVRPDDDLDALGAWFLRTRATRALVTDGDRLLGIVTPFDVLRAAAPAATGIPG